MNSNDMPDMNELEDFLRLLAKAIGVDELQDVYHEMIVDDFSNAPSMMSLHNSVDDDNPMQTLTIRGVIELLIEAAINPTFSHGFSTPVFTGHPFSNVVNGWVGPEAQATTYNPDTDEIVWVNNPDNYSGEYDTMKTLRF